MERNLKNIEDFPIPPDYEVLPRSTKHRDLHDDAMVMGQNGYVFLEATNSMPVRTNLSSSDESERREMYYQIPISELQDTSGLWRLPVAPIRLKGT